MKTVYTDIVGDLFHFGHVNLLKMAKEQGDKLIVGVMSDELVESYKRTPILSLIERVNVINSCKYVDEVVAGAPAPLTKEFLLEHKIDLVIRGDDLDQESINYWYKIPIEMGIFKTISYTQGISTTEIITKIVQRNKNNSL